jgi:hypothetical protein
MKKEFNHSDEAIIGSLTNFTFKNTIGPHLLFPKFHTDEIIDFNFEYLEVSKPIKLAYKVMKNPFSISSFYVICGD